MPPSSHAEPQRRLGRVAAHQQKAVADGARHRQHRNILRNSTVTARTGLSVSQRWRLEQRGEFPARVQLSEMAVGWYEDEVNEWIESRPRGGGKQPPLPKNRRQPPAAASHSNGKLLDRDIDELGLSVRARNALRNEKIIVIGDLVRETKQELLSIPNFGRVSLAEVESALAKLKLHLGTQHSDWDRRRDTAIASAAE